MHMLTFVRDVYVTNREVWYDKCLLAVYATFTLYFQNTIDATLDP